MSRWVIFILGAMAIWIGYLLVPQATSSDVDLETYTVVVHDMRQGQSYYEAMNDGLVKTVGPASTVRAYRFPTVFWLWSIPGMFSWPATLAVITCSAVLVGIATRPFVGLFILVWMAAIAHPLLVQQWAYVELWALPLVLLALIAWRSQHEAVACAAALGAALTRELCVLIIIGGAVAALLCHRRVLPWVAAGAVWTAAFLVHASQVQHYLVAQGTEPPLLRAGGVSSVLTMAGPYTYGLGFVVTGIAIWRTRGLPEWWLVLPLLALIPMAGILTSRFHWGFLVFPTAVALLGSDRSLFPPVTREPPAPAELERAADPRPSSG